MVVALLLAWLLAGRGPCGGSTLVGLGANLKDPGVGLGVMFGVGLSAPRSPSLANVAHAYNCRDPSWERSQLSPPGKRPKIREDSPSNGTGVLRTQRLEPTSKRSCVNTTLLLQEQWEPMMFPC